MKELKTFPALVVKAEGNTITGLGTLFGVIDSYADRSHPGIFAGATPAGVRFCWNHDTAAVPIATIDSIVEVPRADLPKSVQASYPEATGGVLAGAVTDMSYGYDTTRVGLTRLPSGEQIRELYAVDLWEFSDVALRGAVPGTMANIAAAKGYTYAGGLRTGSLSDDSLRLAHLGRKLARLNVDMTEMELTDLRAKARRLRRA
jgi:hypothetical protein